MLRIVAIFIFIPFFGFNQSSGKVWTEVGVKGSITKKMEWAFELTNRFGENGLETFFPQVSLKYKVTKWFRPSIDYRAIFNREKNGNYTFSNRLNANAEFRHVLDRFTFSGRIRYQYSFDRLISTENYNVEFDNAIRLKPQIKYDINNSIFSPVVSLEYFYDPSFGPSGRQFTKYRAFAGVELEIDSPHEISFGYILDQQINTSNPQRKHILSIAYAYNFGYEKE